ncbi:S-adenosyl-L-methionine-dependent methyltransferase [Ascodesmis nigricans]|uniref:S-adenosyl-L-methionine-dependent methyltransferase n=1 Tax=Ascodesmis nigricans TaxID=341454 RepID=A0A4S2MMN1_9PEZI|nr:S-adenosyl-L-methionine-dependent methyltransferase [Ascodesmis nigricans]
MSGNNKLSTALPNPDRERLKTHFSIPVEQHGDAWSSLWSTGTFLPWDRGLSNPALVDLLDSPTAPFKLRPGQTVLVPGCGRGYDVHLFATYGLEAEGLEIAPDAVRMAREWIETELKKRELPEGGKAVMKEGDFYKRDWEREGGYDYVFDYTFLCAMPPTLRPSWAVRMSEIVKPGGHLICLEFPLFKDPATGGPPFGLNEGVYVELLGEKFERVVRFKPERTHKIGEGSDHVSVWKRKGKESVL